MTHSNEFPIQNVERALAALHARMRADGMTEHSDPAMVWFEPPPDGVDPNSLAGVLRSALCIVVATRALHLRRKWTDEAAAVVVASRVGAEPAGEHERAEFAKRTWTYDDSRERKARDLLIETRHSVFKALRLVLEGAVARETAAAEQPQPNTSNGDVYAYSLARQIAFAYSSLEHHLRQVNGVIPARTADDWDEFVTTISFRLRELGEAYGEIARLLGDIADGASERTRKRISRERQRQRDARAASGPDTSP